MFDYHLHSGVSFDTDSSAEEMAQRARNAGLREICFTDHYDYGSYPWEKGNLFSLDEYYETYDSLEVPGLVIRKGVEIGLAEWNVTAVDEFLTKCPFDFVIGSIHMVDGNNAYLEDYWKGKTTQEAFTRYLEHTLNCVKLHHNFDVLGHLTFVSKSPHNTTGAGVSYQEHSEIADEIMRLLAENGIGMEINTSAMERIHDFLPSADYFRRFKELGGEIVTVGSDAHNADRVGAHIDEALQLAKEIFGYVCTFEDRKPKIHKF